MNLCRNTNRDKYHIGCHYETEDLWVSKKFTRPPDVGPASFKETVDLYGKGVGISDLCYLIRSDIPYKFEDYDEDRYSAYYRVWPKYATPCFEMYFTKFVYDNGFEYAALKPVDGVPVIKHKNVHHNAVKKKIYLFLGIWGKNGKYSTKVD